MDSIDILLVSILWNIRNYFFISILLWCTLNHISYIIPILFLLLYFFIFKIKRNGFMILFVILSSFCFVHFHPKLFDA